MIVVGDIVKVKSLASIVAEGRLDSEIHLPAYAVSMMRKYYGSNNAYPVVKIEDLDNNPAYPSGVRVFLRTTGGGYSFDLADLEKIEDLSRHITPVAGHAYKLTTDIRLKGIFNSIFADFDEYAGNIVHYYGEHSGDDGEIRLIEVDIPEKGISGFTLAPYLIAEDLGMIEGYDVNSVRCRCHRCSRMYTSTRDELDSLFPEDANFCPECRKREFITPYHRYTPHLEFRNTEKDENPNLYLGVELEVGKGGEFDFNAAEAMRIMNKDNRFIYCSHDSSINNGFEIITMPGTIEYHKSRSEDYRKMFQKLVQMGYRSHDDRTCGLHVHFSREYYRDNGKEHVNTVKLIYLIKKFWREIMLFSRKDSDAINHYAKCVDESENDFYHHWNCSEDHDGHYYALNIVNENTIEFRIFRGTLNLKTYMLTLTMVYNMITMAKNHKLVELSAMKFEDFLDDDGKEYFNLRKAMKGFGIAENTEGGDD